MKNIAPENWYRNSQFLFWLFVVTMACATYGSTQFFSWSWTVNERQFHWALAKARGWSLVPILGGREKIRVGAQRVAAGELVTFARARPGVWQVSDKIIFRSFEIGVGGGFVVVLVVVLFSSRGSRSARGDKHLRGARLVSPGRLRARLMLERARDWLLDRGQGVRPITIGGLPIPRSLEPYHFLFASDTGTGKSLSINGLLDPLRAREDRVIMCDSGGEAMARWYRRGDIILNPLDRRSVAWSPFAELAGAGPWHADRIAKSMVPDREGVEGEWALYSQSLITAVLQRLHERGEATNERLLYFLTVAKSDEIEQLVSGLPAQTLFDVGATKMLSSVRGIIGSYLPSYRFLQPSAGVNAFSIRKWVHSGTGWLWIPYLDDQLDALRPLLSGAIGEIVSAVLSLRPNPNRRLWLMLDEVASLGRVQALNAALEKGRKYGLCCVFGLQNIAQLRRHYGLDGAQTLCSNLSSWLLMRTRDGETNDYLSRSLGEAEIRRENISRGDRGETVSEQRATPRVVLPSEIKDLPNRTGFLDLAGDYPVTRVEIPIIDRPEVIPPFAPRVEGFSPPPKPKPDPFIDAVVDALKARAGARTKTGG